MYSWDKKYSLSTCLVKAVNIGRLNRVGVALLFSLGLIVLPALCFGQQLIFSQPLTERWQYTTEGTINLTPAADGNYVYLPLTAGELVALQASDGQLLWKSDMGGTISAAPEADERGVYVATETTAQDGAQTFYPATGALFALSRKSGVTLWMHTLSRPVRGALAANDTTVFAGTADGHVYAFGKETGEVRWVVQYSASFAAQPVFKEARLYLGSNEGALFALNTQTGQALWHYQTHGALHGPVAVANNLVLFGSSDGYVYALEEETGRLRWRTRTGAGVQSVAATPNGLIVASLDNFVYLLSYRRGERIWKRRLAGRIAAQPLTSTDSALFVPLGGDACVVLALHDGKIVNSLEVGTDANTAASPIIAGSVLLITTRHGLMAFAPPDSSAQH
jgi:eukaryotic-like serine/threonine-protein kinase